MSLETINRCAAEPLTAHLSCPVAVQPDSRKLEVRWASCEDDVQQAQRLRHRVFAEEMGARLTPLVGTAPGHDADRFDPFCDHLLVSASGRCGFEPEMLVGTYRVLAPAAARRAGGLYIDTEFDLAPLSGLRANAVELGRSCVHPAWRSGGVIMALWTALGRYMLTHRLDTMIGCVSVGLGDGGLAAGNLWRQLRQTHLVAPQWQVRPHVALPPQITRDSAMPEACDTALPIRTPPLIKGYLRCGARLLGPPALDTAFNTTDLPMMLRADDLAARYRKHFLAAG